MPVMPYRVLVVAMAFCVLPCSSFAQTAGDPLRMPTDADTPLQCGTFYMPTSGKLYMAGNSQPKWKSVCHSGATPLWICPAFTDD